MGCDVYEGMLPDYVNGSLEGRDRSALEGHLADCEACREALALERRLDAALSRGLVSMPPDGLTARVLSQVREERSHGRLLADILQPAAYAASLAALLVGLRQGLSQQWGAFRELAGTGLAEASPSLNGIAIFGNGWRSWLNGLFVDLGTWMTEPMTLETIGSTGLMGLGIGGALISVLWASYLVLRDSESSG